MAVVKAGYYRAAFAINYPCVLARTGEYFFIRTNGGYYAVFHSRRALEHAALNIYFSVNKCSFHLAHILSFIFRIRIFR